MIAARLRGVLAAAFLVVATDAWAGGPLVTTTNGIAVGWDTSASVTYRTDLGGLGALSNAEAIATVGALFDVWTAVPSTVISYVREGATAVDVDATNFGPFLGPYGGASAPLGQNVIVFDADGAIFDTLFGVGTGVLGFAGPTFMSDGTTTVAIGSAIPPGARIVEGLAFLNGKWIDGISDSGIGNYELPLDVFESAFVHEFGHFSGLDHTQIHGLVAPADSDLREVTQPIETMNPFIYDATQKTLERDDAVALSTLYPSATFASSTGRITGRVRASDGQLLSGVNVVARNVADDGDAVSYVAGATVVPAGSFALNGLTPGASYRVEVQPVDVFHTDGSRVGPFSPPIVMPGPPEAYNGAAESADPAVDDQDAATPILAAAGVTTANIDLTLNSQPFAVTNFEVPNGGNLRKVAFGDFDGDGVVDFVAPHFGFFANVTSFYRGVGDGSFAPPVVIDAFNGNDFAIAGQFNAGVDGFLDVAVMSGSLAEIRVYFGDGAGGFAPPVTIFDLPNDPTQLALDMVGGDVDGDGDTDLVTFRYDFVNDNATTDALLGNPTGTFTLVSSFHPTGSGFPRSEMLRVAQLAGSPALDIVGVGSGTNLGILTGDGAGGFSAMSVSLAAVTGLLGNSLDVGDFNEDGRTDLVVSDLHPVGGPANYTRSFIDVLIADGAGGFTLSASYFVPESFQDGIVAARLDGDSHLDVASVGAWFGPTRPGAKVSVAYGNGAGGVGARQTIWGLAEFPNTLAAADLNGDGRTDLFAGSNSKALGLAARPPFYSVLLQDPCGNGAAEAPEQCDDGNRTNGDGCDGNCTVTACGNGIVAGGEQCDDGNTLAGDGCSPTCTAEGVCGDGSVTYPEECDDGNVAAGDCCSPTCTLEPVGVVCDAGSGNLCLAAACNLVGSCVPHVAAPRTTCRQLAISGAGRLTLSDSSDDLKDRLHWRWTKGTITPKAAFGDPTTATNYGLCVYDNTATLLALANVAAGGVCNPLRPSNCWKETASGYRYTDASAATDGVRRIGLHQGLQSRRATVVVAAKGPALALPALPINPDVLPLRVQLNAGNGECWEATYGTHIGRNNAESFTATAD